MWKGKLAVADMARRVSAHGRPLTGWRGRWLVSLCAVLTLLCLDLRGAHAQGLEHRVDEATFFSAEPGWLLQAAVMAGADGHAAYPQLNLGVARLFANHWMLGGHVDLRLDGPFHLRAGIRTGVFLTRGVLTLSTGTSLGLLWVAPTQEVGAVVTPWLLARVRVSEHWSLDVRAEIDLLFDRLGFSRTRQLYTGGIGAAFRF